MKKAKSKPNNARLPIVIALGGSIIVPNFPAKRSGKINTSFLKKFRKLILKHTKSGKKFVIVAGGGAIARNYQKAASKIVRISNEDKDWIGIHSTRLNSHLLRTLFWKGAYSTVVDNPYKPIKTRRKIIIASGWRPGWSTDYITILLAKRFKVREAIIAGRPDYVYTKDTKYKNARPVKEISWRNYQKLIGRKWIPGMSAPVDPVATKLAKKSGLKAIIIQGTNLKNLEKVIEGRKFKGTIIY